MLAQKEVTSSPMGYTEDLCDHYAIGCKGLESLWIWGSDGGPRINSL